MPLWEELKENDRKGLFTSDDHSISYPTGITALDYANGYWSEALDSKGQKIMVSNLGIPAGSMISIIGNTGTGKALDDDTIIHTYKRGDIRLRCLEVGDYVYDDKGKRTKVLGIYPQGTKEAYEVIFEDDSRIVCSADHLWSIYTKDGLQTMSLKTIMDEHAAQAKVLGIAPESVEYPSIPLSKSIKYKTRNLPINPRAMGILLMNGIFDTKDLYVAGNLAATTVAKLLKAKAQSASPKECISNDILDGEDYYVLKTGLFRKIKNDTLLSDKNLLVYGVPRLYRSIPSMYLTAASADRFELLSGILDVNGFLAVDTDSLYAGINISKIRMNQMYKDIVALSRSLGFYTTMKVDGPNVRIKIKLTYELAKSIFQNNEKALYFLNRLGPGGAGRYSDRPNRLRIIKIRHVGKRKMRCILVDSKSHLFVAGKTPSDFIVTHNTTFGIQIGWNIVKKFEDGMMFIIDCEKTTSMQRVRTLTRTSKDEPRIILDKSHTSIEDVLEIFNKVCEIKEAEKKKFMYEVVGRSSSGKPFMQYVPTVFIIDSLPSFNSKEYNVEDLGNNIDGMRASKDIARFYTNVLDRAWKYNCIFMVINHIRPSQITNPYARPPQGLLMINPDVETLPRGNIPQYYSNTFFRIRTKKSAAYKMDEVGFTGYKCEVVLAKSKTNTVGTVFPVTFNNETGFDPVYSLYEFASDLGLIQGRNPYLYIQGFDDYKFNRKDFNNLMTGEPGFRTGVLTALKPYFVSLLGTKKEPITIENEESTTPTLEDIDLESIAD